MATNYQQEGCDVTVVAPYAVTAGNVVIFNSGTAFAVAQANASSGANVTVAFGGVWALPKTSGASTSAALGAAAYWDNTNSKVTISATSNTKIGIFTAAQANADTTVYVRLNTSF